MREGFMEKTELVVCLYCHQKSLWFNKVNNSFECLNSKCSNYNVPISMVSFNRNNQQIVAEKKALDESTAKARLWNGNQYWDGKKMSRWRPAYQNPPYSGVGSHHRSLHSNQYCYNSNS
jgi:hypothetical protein